VESCFGLGEALEQLAESLLRYADAGARDSEGDGIAVALCCQNDRDLIGEPGGIAEHVEETLAQLRAVAAHGAGIDPGRHLAQGESLQSQHQAECITISSLARRSAQGSRFTRDEPLGMLPGKSLDEEQR
jgi:hypothetical protein